MVEADYIYTDVTEQKDIEPQVDRLRTDLNEE